ncbi:MAG: Cd(II)/Pb(II)-responsive transcriptional regulator [Geobacteraceae bacterium]|nr:Cd(II)/Pb(II)-responsive transcriptional regulator [Geobacteraceae bacterium]
MLIGELAKQAGCEAGTIRYYESEGLLEKAARSESGYRRYTGKHLGQLHFVLHCRSLGMTLSEIRTLQNLQSDTSTSCDEVSALLEQQIERIHRQIEAMHALETQLTALRNCCHDNLPASECGILKSLQYAAEESESTGKRKAVRKK